MTAWWLFLVTAACCGGWPALAQLDQVLALFSESTDGVSPGQGCFFYEWRFGPFMRNVTNPRHSHSPSDCQKQCMGTDGCEYFGYKKAQKECWLADSSMHEVQSDSRFVSGPRHCVPVSPMCTETVGDGFPGNTPAESNAAWATGLVPPNLQCWPRRGDLSLSPCVGEAIKVLDDSQEGWPGRCFGLKKITLPVDRADLVAPHCQAYCEVDAGCAAWQAVSRDGGATAECWMGMGYDCDRPRHDNSFSLVAGQRFMRGSYRVLMDLAGYEVMGLKLAFPASRFTRMELAIESCNHTCLSNIQCEVWTYSTAAGCRVSDPKFRRIPYPPTIGSFSKTAPGAISVIAGQYIQHICSHPQNQGGEPAVTPAPVVVTTPSVPTTYTTTSTTPLTTSTTTHAPGTPEPAKADRFIRGESGQWTYFQDHETSTKHLVRAGCDVCMPRAPCEDFVTVSDWYVYNLPTGEDFECNMLGHQGPLRTQEDILHGHLNEEIHLAPLPPVTLDFTVQSLRYDTVAGGQMAGFYQTVRQEIATEAGCPLQQVTVTVEPRGPSRFMGVKAAVNVSRSPTPALGQASVQRVQSRLSANAGNLAERMVISLDLWVRRAQVVRASSEGLIGIDQIYTSIAGMEMLQGYAPTTTTTSTTTTSSTSTSSTTNAAEIVRVLGSEQAANRLTVDHGQPGSASTFGWIFLVLVFFGLFVSSAVFVFDSKSRRRFKRAARRGIAVLKQRASSKSDDEEEGGETQGEEETENKHGSFAKSDTESEVGRPLMEEGTREMGPEAIPTFSNQPLDLVTVTPHGLQVTPLGSGAPPPGVPVMDPRLAGQGFQGQNPLAAQQPQPPLAGGMDLVQVTANGLNVTPLNGAPPAGVPYLDPANGMQMGGVMPLGMQDALSRSRQRQLMERQQATGAPLGTQMALQPSEEYDLVTVTAGGLQVQPFEGNPAATGLPVCDPTRQAPVPIGTMPSMPGMHNQMHTAALPTTVFK
jgi:hypothetical protein